MKNTLYIAQSNISGNGVFTWERIFTWALIESCRVIILSILEQKYIDKTKLYDYYFLWGDDSIALALWNGSIYNHSYQPNAEYKRSAETDTLDFYAIKDIQPWQEITVNYNGRPDCQEPVWFEK